MPTADCFGNKIGLLVVCDAYLHTMLLYIACPSAGYRNISNIFLIILWVGLKDKLSSSLM